jgi:hypothetical protein
MIDPARAELRECTSDGPQHIKGLTIVVPGEQA